MEETTMKVAARVLMLIVVLASSSFGVQIRANFAGGGGPIPMPPQAPALTK
jgi:hypothetical protein